MKIGFIELFGKTASQCDNPFFGLPPWFKYLQLTDDCAPKISGLNDIWLIGLAIIEILLRIAILAAIGFVVFAGIKYSASRGNADKVQAAKSTLTDALTGLVIVIVAAAVVSFIAGRFTE